jgi:hypothetical protein
MRRRYVIATATTGAERRQDAVPVRIRAGDPSPHRPERSLAGGESATFPATFKGGTGRVLSSLSAIEPVMTRVNLEIELPDSLAEQAREAGLLEPNAVERLVREALLRRRVDNLGRAR